MKRKRYDLCKAAGAECGRRRSYGFPGGCPELCRRHALEGMVDVRHEECEHSTS